MRIVKDKKMQEFGLRLKFLREHKGISRYRVAEITGNNYDAVAKWESGARLPDIFTFMKLADLLDVSAKELVEASELEKSTVDLSDLSKGNYDLVIDFINLLRKRQK